MKKIHEVLSELEDLGTAQNRKVYARHGVKGPAYGVSYAHIRKLGKKLAADQELALDLWGSGNHDARVLATLVADPLQVDRKTLDGWAKDVDNYVLGDAFSGLAANTASAVKAMERWTRSKHEWVGSCGWNLLASLAASEELTDDYFVKFIERIEDSVKASPNRVRHAMNMALIAIALRSRALEEIVAGVARRLGPIEVDHGETNCKTPEILPYIEHAKAQREVQKGRAGARKSDAGRSRKKSG